METQFKEKFIRCNLRQVLTLGSFILLLFLVLIICPMTFDNYAFADETYTITYILNAA